MRKLVLVSLLVVLFAVFAVAARLHRNTAKFADAPAGGRQPVIVELFTSEGCSSCPPADALLAKLEEKQPIANAEVIALEEHVDYWNQLGWIDPYSSSAWTGRQEDYAQAFGSGSVYTPEMVVNGTTEFVGSHERKAVQSIEEAARQAGVDIAVTQKNLTGGTAEHFAVSVDRIAAVSPKEPVEVWLAVTETGLHSSVTRGENAGEDLHHAAVVRSLGKIGEVDKSSKDSPFTAEPTVAINPSWKRNNLKVVVFAQEKKSRRILGAASAPVAE